MRPILCLCLLALAALPAVELADLKTERQEKLYYQRANLPKVVQELIEKPLAVRELRACFDATADEKIRFNLLLIIDKKIREGKLIDGERDQAVAMLVDVVRDGNPWIQTEGVYAIGNAEGAAGNAAIITLLDSKSDLAFFHAVFAYQQINGKLPDLTAEQRQRLVRVNQVMQGPKEEIDALAERELATFMSRFAF
jgi:hypothetical protein